MSKDLANWKGTIAYELAKTENKKLLDCCLSEKDLIRTFIDILKDNPNIKDKESVNRAIYLVSIKPRMAWSIIASYMTGVKVR